MKCVVDASFIASVLLPDESSSKSTAVLAKLAGERAVSPAFLQLEITNVLLISERRKRITGVETTQLLGFFDGLPISLQAESSAEHRAKVLHLAQKHQLTAYDAVYLELAVRLAVPLLTLDAALGKAAKVEGVALTL
jgi:predicted nucleic acid-binding protein